jgi:uncharacterized protein YjiS (DUF1127 family)
MPKDKLMTEMVSGAANRSAGRAPIGLVRWIAARIARSMATRRRRLILNEMSDDLLKDIGVSRSDIEYVAAAFGDGREDQTRRRRG